MPVKIRFQTSAKVSKGYPLTETVKLLCDSVTFTAPIHPNSNVTCIAKLEADLGQIPKHEVKEFIQRLPNGDKYYVFKGTVEATFGSASMEYVLVMEGKCYLFLAGVIDSSKFLRRPLRYYLCQIYLMGYSGAVKCPHNKRTVESSAIPAPFFCSSFLATLLRKIPWVMFLNSSKGGYERCYRR